MLELQPRVQTGNLPNWPLVVKTFEILPRDEPPLHFLMDIFACQWEVVATPESIMHLPGVFLAAVLIEYRIWLDEGDIGTDRESAHKLQAPACSFHVQCGNKYSCGKALDKKIKYLQ
jgi:hypothetical protein